MLNEIENSEQICRLCLGKTADHDIFVESSIVDKITSCCTLQV